MSKNIIIVIGSLEVGGTEQHLVRVLSKMMTVRPDYRYQILTLGKKGILAANLEKLGILVTPLIQEHEFKILSKLPGFFRRIIAVPLMFVRLILFFYKIKSQSTILHFYLPTSYVLGMLASLCAGLKQTRIMSRRSLNHYQKKMPGLLWLEKYLHRKVDYITANSLAILNQLATEEAVPPHKLKLLYNGIDIENFIKTTSREETRAELQISEHEIVLIIVANLILYKGHADLLKALAIVNKALKNKWRVLIVGRDDGIGADLKQQAKALGIADNVLWMGPRGDIPRLYKAADIGLLCSHQEGFSNAILEGMAAELPMVVTDVGGNKEAVVTGETGFVVPARNPEALADAILNLIYEPNKAKQFGAQGFIRVKTQFSLDMCCKAYQELYDAVENDVISNEMNICAD